MNLIHIIDCYYRIWIQSAIDNERCLWLWGSNANVIYGKIYSVPAPIELCVKWYGRHQCFLSRSRFTPCLSMEGGLSVIMVMEDCQCSYTGLFDQVPGVIRNGRVISNLSLHHIFIYRKVVWHKDATFFFSSATRTDLKSKGSCLALVCGSIKFIDFFFFWTISKNKQQKKEAKKQNKTKQNKQKQNPH